MAEVSTIARPYAKAAFAEARDSGRFAEWAALLGTAAAIVRDPAFAALIGNPQVAAGTLSGLLDEAAGSPAGEPGSNFLRLLDERRRLHALPAMQRQYEALWAEAESRVDVEVTAAVELTEAQRAKFAAALQKRLGREVVIHAHIDASVIGGAIVRAGDLVIDGSIKGRLERLAATLG